MVSCKSCGKRFRNKTLLMRHNRWSHRRNGARYECTKPGCGHVAKQRSDLKKHMEAHRRSIRRHMANPALRVDNWLHDQQKRNRARYRAFCEPRRRMPVRAAADCFPDGPAMDDAGGADWLGKNLRSPSLPNTYSRSVKPMTAENTSVLNEYQACGAQSMMLPLHDIQCDTARAMTTTVTPRASLAANSVPSPRYSETHNTA